jgi:hypothetical protein
MITRWCGHHWQFLDEQGLKAMFNIGAGVDALMSYGCRLMCQWCAPRRRGHVGFEWPVRATR